MAKYTINCMQTVHYSVDVDLTDQQVEILLKSSDSIGEVSEMDAYNIINRNITPADVIACGDFRDLHIEKL